MVVQSGQFGSRGGHYLCVGLRYGEAGSNVSEYPQGTGWWLASDGRWYAPGHGPDAAMRSSVEASDEPSPDKGPEVEEGDDHLGETPEPADETQPAPPRRSYLPTLGSVLDRGAWVWLWVIGAILLIVLIIVALSQVQSNPKKGNGPDQVRATVPTIQSSSRTGTTDDHWLEHPPTPISVTAQPSVVIGPSREALWR